MCGEKVPRRVVETVFLRVKMPIISSLLNIMSKKMLDKHAWLSATNDIFPAQKVIFIVTVPNLDCSVILY